MTLKALQERLCPIIADLDALICDVEETATSLTQIGDARRLDTVRGALRAARWCAGAIAAASRAGEEPPE